MHSCEVGTGGHRSITGGFPQRLNVSNGYIDCPVVLSNLQGAPGAKLFVCQPVLILCLPVELLELRDISYKITTLGQHNSFSPRLD